LDVFDVGKLLSDERNSGEIQPIDLGIVEPGSYVVGYSARSTAYVEGFACGLCVKRRVYDLVVHEFAKALGLLLEACMFCVAVYVVSSTPSTKLYSVLQYLLVGKRVLRIGVVVAPLLARAPIVCVHGGSHVGNGEDNE
jgi:hypothetical protein